MLYSDPFVGSDGLYDPATDTYTGDGGHSMDPTLNAGLGILYHINDSWAVRADARTFLTVGDVNANSLFNVGAEYTWGAAIPEDNVFSKIADADGDGLTDGEEKDVYRTDPQNPDTDGDGLNDYDEVKVC
mgnify:FL=1